MSTRPGSRCSLDLTRELGNEGITLVMARLRRRLIDDFDVAGLTSVIGREHLYPSVRLAVDAFAGLPTETDEQNA